MTEKVSMFHGSNCRAIPPVKDLKEYEEFVRKAFELAVDFDKQFIESNKPPVKPGLKEFSPMPLNANPSVKIGNKVVTPAKNSQDDLPDIQIE